MGADAGEELMLEPNGHDEKIYVSVRVRPLNEKEKARNDVSDWECINDNTVLYRNPFQTPERSLYPTAYTFDKVFGCNCSTRQVYEDGAKEVALSVVSGINSSVFAYGQTSSGKTYTMCGVTEFTVADIYDYIDRHKEREFLLKFSAMEIYNESVRDLLISDSTPLRLLDDPERGTIVEKLTEETLRDWNHFKELLSVCESQRQIGDTSLNETSSRSHQILRLTVESSTREFLGNGNSSALTATVNFVDLAGSERASQALSAGTRLKEGCHINRSLLTLGTVIRKLSKGRTGHIPFRDSKLTRILQSTLGGNARTAIICTMSPARSHVEQSRNTLLFASCAKEVTTSAQVNVVMSDKALVKHLQRELARLESELRTPSSTFVASDPAVLLREKDLEIEKLKNEIKELTLQQEQVALEQQQLALDRDLAQSQLKDLLRIVETSRHSVVSADDDNQYPNYIDGNQYPQLRVRTPASTESQSSDVGVRRFDGSQYSDAHSRSNPDDNYIQFSDMDESLQHGDMSPPPSVSIPTYIRTHMPLGETEDQIDMNSDDLCKEVRCIEMEESSESRYTESILSYSEKKMAISGVTEVENGDEINQESESPSLKDDKVEHIKRGSAMKSPDTVSPWYLEKGMPSSRSLKMIRSQSCKESFIASSLSHSIERKENIENTSPYRFENEFTGTPETFQRKPAALAYVADSESLKRNSSPNSVESSVVDDLKVQKTQTSRNANCINCNTPVKEIDELSEYQNENQLADHEVQETKQKCTEDVMDLIQDNSKSMSNWPSEFERLQREIIELWNACSVSLVHRTYFFLQCQGEPKDSIYMELELRRLSTLKNSISQGKQSAEHGQRYANPMSYLVSNIAGLVIGKGEMKLSSTNSNKATCRERLWLRKRMKKLSDNDRQNLYLRWGIGLNSKHRKLQLAQRLWTDTVDIQHITESAKVVAKLVRNVQPEGDFKEMVGLYFVPRHSNWKFYQWKSSGNATL